VGGIIGRADGICRLRAGVKRLTLLSGALGNLLSTCHLGGFVRLQNPDLDVPGFGVLAQADHRYLRGG
jgi:hypothetical protein